MKYIYIIISSFLLICLFSCTSKKVDVLADLANSRKTSLQLYVTAIEAYKILQGDNGVVFIDVRTRAEVAFLGMPALADTNIPYMLVGDWDEWDKKKNTFKTYPNSNFLPYFDDYIHTNNLSKDSKIILICRSGNRSAKAVNILAKVGYTNVYTVIDGFEGSNKTNGWKNKNLPWSNQLNQNKMYQEGF